MVLLIDNYDSFTYNLVQALGALGARPEVYRNDAMGIDEIRGRSPSRIVISPGPGRPEDAGISLEVIRRLAEEVPILGVCLGHQCIARAFGGEIVQAGRLVHGKTTPIRHDGIGCLRGVPSPFVAARYHSLAVEAASLPSCLVPSAWTEGEEIMGIRHRELPLEGVQFHPESFLTETGGRILRNFLEGSRP